MIHLQDEGGELAIMTMVVWMIEELMQMSANSNTCPDCVLRYTAAFCFANLLIREVDHPEEVKPLMVGLAAAELGAEAYALVREMAGPGAGEEREFFPQPKH